MPIRPNHCLAHGPFATPQTRRSPSTNKPLSVWGRRAHHEKVSMVFDVDLFRLGNQVPLPADSTFAKRV
jgi:hypothetical protein